jgi:hypothetical protein
MVVTCWLCSTKKAHEGGKVRVPCVVSRPRLLAHMRRANSLICLPDTERSLQYIGDRRRRCLPITAEEPAAPTRKTYAGISNHMPNCRFCAIYRCDQPILP